MDVTARGAEDCSYDNPGCSGVEVSTYAVAVGTLFAGGMSGSFYPFIGKMVS